VPAAEQKKATKPKIVYGPYEYGFKILLTEPDNFEVGLCYKFFQRPKSQRVDKLGYYY